MIPWRLILTILLHLQFLVTANPQELKRPNVIFILADDLGYGDLGWKPFTGKEMEKISTPNLQRLAGEGKIFTNFHVASPTCSPSRASFMTGLFPWRLGLDFIYGDANSHNNEQLTRDQLPLISNLASSLQASGYYTAHVGKWHLGGQNLDQIEARRAGNCSSPGIDQYGFNDSVVMSEGVNSNRFRTQIARNTYSLGANYLLHNDQPLPKPTTPIVLTDAQTNEAIGLIRQHVRRSPHSPFFLNLWYDAPHSPWEAITPFYDEYSTQDFSTDQMRKYASMIRSLDANVGRLLKEIDDLALAEDTLVIFTSDNGPEAGAGSAGPFTGRKRLLTEGGITVPAIFRWKGKISAMTSSSKFLLSTDVFPTVLEACSVSFPPALRLDGVSFLSVLLGSDDATSLMMGDERVVTWHSNAPGYPMTSAIRAFGLKIIWNLYPPATKKNPHKNLPPAWRIFDLYADPTEKRDLYPLFRRLCAIHLRDQTLLRPDTAALPLDKIARRERGSGPDVISPSSETLLLIRHLEMTLHLFRARGGSDYDRFYRPNRFFSSFHSAASCGSDGGRLKQQLFPWMSVEVLPAFCGSALSREIAFAHSCACALNPSPSPNLSSWRHCSSFWQSSAQKVMRESTIDDVTQFWMVQPAYFGLTSLMPLQGSYQQHLRTLLRWSDYRGICANTSEVVVEEVEVLLHHYDAITRSSAKQIDVSQLQCNEEVFEEVPGSSLLTNAFNASFKPAQRQFGEGGFSAGDVFQQHPSWQRRCVSRVFYDVSADRFSLQSAVCGYDRPLLFLHYDGMAADFPLALCPQSLQKMMFPDAARNDVDDNILLFLQHTLLLATSTSSPHLLSKDHSFNDLPRHHDLLSLDPLLAPHLLREAAVQRLVKTSGGKSKKEEEEAVTSLLLRKYVSFFYERSQHFYSKAQLGFVFLPIGHWAGAGRGFCWTGMLLTNVRQFLEASLSGGDVAEVGVIVYHGCPVTSLDDRFFSRLARSLSLTLLRIALSRRGRGDEVEGKGVFEVVAVAGYDGPERVTSVPSLRAIKMMSFFANILVSELYYYSIADITLTVSFSFVGEAASERGKEVEGGRGQGGEPEHHP